MNSPYFTAARYLSGGFSVGIHIGQDQVEAAPVAKGSLNPNFRIQEK